MKNRILLVLGVLACCFSNLLAQSNIRRHEYWIDDNYDKKVVVSSANTTQTYTLDLTKYSTGLHFFNHRSQEANGHWGAQTRSPFYVPPTDGGTQDVVSPLKGYEYWIDDDYAHKKYVASTNGTNNISLDVSSLSPGPHHLNVRFINKDGRWGAASRTAFYVSEANGGTQESVSSIAGYEYWFDDDYAHKTFVASAEVNYNLTFDVDAFSEGNHYFNLRYVNRDGKWGALSRTAFYVPVAGKDEDDTVSPIAGCEYWLDNDYEHKTYKKTSSTTVVASIPVDELKPGIHSINFRAHNEAGRWGAMTHNVFYLNDTSMKGDEGAKIIGYRYSFGEESKYVSITPCTEYALNNKILTMPEATEYASLDEGCSYEFSGSKVTLHRDSKSVFSLQFENENHKWSNPACLELEVKDDLTKTVSELRAQSSVTLEKVGRGDFNALKIDITESDNYYFKSTQPCRIDLYTASGQLYQTLDEKSLLTVCEAGLLEGTYYGIVRDHKTNSDVTIRMLLTEGLTPDPTFTLENTRLTITSMEGAKIYYTLDGTTPTVSSTLYTSPVQLQSNCTVKAVAKHPDLAISDVSSFKVDVFKVAKPEVLFANLKLYMSCSTPNARLYYTIDGSDPVVNGKLYTAPVTINHNATVKIVGKRDGYNDSDITEYTLDLDNVTCITPEFHREGNLLTISSLTEGVTIYYTLEGNDPTAMYEPYKGAINLTHNCMVKAYAAKEGLLSSETVSYLVDWFQAEMPEFTFADGKLSMACATPGSTIYYTIGGGIPSRYSQKYVKPIEISDNRSVSAIAVAEGFKDSEVATYNTDMFSCETPELAYDGRAITITTETPGATIYYTIDGTNPTVNSPIYSGTTILDGLCTVRAIAIKDNMNNSNVKSLTLPSYYNGGKVYVETAGKMAEAFTWCGGMPELVTLTVCGNLNATDVALIKTASSVKFLDISDVTIDELKDEALADMNLITVSLPTARFNVGRRILVGCTNLAAIEWNSTNKVPEDIVGDAELPNLLLYVKNASSAGNVFKNVVVDRTAEAITLQDSKSSNFYCPHEFTARKITYTHNYSQLTGNGKCMGWETIALPFAPTSIHHAKNGQMAPFAAGDAAKKPFWLSELTEGGFVNSDAIAANTPYIIAMPNNDHYADEYILAGDVTFEGSNVKVLASSDLNYGSKGDKTFVPNFMNTGRDECMTLNVGEEYQGHAVGSIFVQSLRNASPFEAYVTVEGMKQTPRRQVFCIDGTETGIEAIEARNITVKAANSTIFVSGTTAGDVVRLYNTAGSMIHSSVAYDESVQIKNVNAGIYIVTVSRDDAVIKSIKINL